MLNNILVYVNISIVVYKFNVDCIVYMNSIIVLARLNGCTEHIHAEQAKLSIYSLWFAYEQPNKHIIHKQTNNLYDIIWLYECLFVWLHQTV